MELAGHISLASAGGFSPGTGSEHPGLSPGSAQGAERSHDSTAGDAGPGLPDPLCLAAEVGYSRAEAGPSAGSRDQAIDDSSRDRMVEVAAMAGAEVLQHSRNQGRVRLSRSALWKSMGTW